MTYSKLDESWVPGPDGTRWRKAARVILLRCPSVPTTVGSVEPSRGPNETTPPSIEPVETTDATTFPSVGADETSPRHPAALKEGSQDLLSAQKYLKPSIEPEILLIRGHDADNPGRSWWFTVGGGIDKGETAREAALREVFEETGIQLTDNDIVGPIAYRTAIFDFLSETVRQDEVFFAALIPADQSAVASATTDNLGWTALEKDVLDEVAWLTPSELKNQHREYYPENLPEIASKLAQQLFSPTGWDGTIFEMPPEDRRKTAPPSVEVNETTG